MITQGKNLTIWKKRSLLRLLTGDKDSSLLPHYVEVAKIYLESGFPLEEISEFHSPESLQALTEIENYALSAGADEEVLESIRWFKKKNQEPLRVESPGEWVRYGFHKCEV